MSVVSLVPSVTDTIAALGAGPSLLGVTQYCAAGAPPDVPRIGGTKNPDVAAIVALAPRVVIANAEENRAEDIAALRDARLDVRVTFPKTVGDTAGLITQLAGIVDADPSDLLSDLEAARAQAEGSRPATPVAHLTLVWRKPWMGLGPDTYADDLLRSCGFANVLAGWDDRYPRLAVGLYLGPQVVLLPSEPYAFAARDLDAVLELTDAPARFVDGQLLTWHGARTAEALRTFTALAAELSGAQ